MLELSLMLLWLAAFTIAAVPPIGRWVYVRYISYLESLKTFIESNPFA